MANQRKALVVATDRYADPSLRQLAAPAADAAALAEVLSAPDLGAFSVDLLTNAQSWEVDGAVETLFTESDASDLLLLHFSCHGIKDERGELFLAASNTVPNRLMSTAVEAAQVSRLMQRSRAQRIVLLLDCCYGGAFERGMVARAAGDVDVADQFSQTSLAAGRGRVVITSSSAMEYAFEGAQLTDSRKPTPSLFTGALVEGIRTGEADRDQDGQVALHELYDYVHDKVRQQTPNQTPSKWEFGVQGDLFVARNPRRRIVAARLPTELVRLTEHPTTPMRLAAVLELEQLAVGSDLPVAAGARVRLGELENDDSRRVSLAATDALRRTSVRVTPEAVDTGEVASGQPVHLNVKVEGSPLALASEVSSSLERLDARIEGHTLRISVRTAEPGPLDGAIRLSGPAGEASVTIRGVVVAGARTPTRTLLTEPTTTEPRATRPTTTEPTTTEPTTTEPTTTEPTTTEPTTTEPRATDQQAGVAGNRELAAVLMVAGSVAMALSFILVGSGALADSSNNLHMNPSTRNVWLLGLPMAAFAAAPLLFRPGISRSHGIAVAQGIALASALWSWVLVVRVVVPAIYVDGLGTTLRGIFVTALWLRLLAAVAFTLVSAVLVERSEAARVPPRLRSDARALLGAVIVLGGAMVLPIGLQSDGYTAAQVAGGWAQAAVFWVVILPLAVIRLTPAQREAVLIFIVAFTVFAGARAVSVSGSHGFFQTATGAGLVMLACLLIGIAVSQVPTGARTP